MLNLTTVIKTNSWFKVVTDKGNIVVYDTYDLSVYESTIKLLNMMEIKFEVVDWSRNNEN